MQSPTRLLIQLWPQMPIQFVYQSEYINTPSRQSEARGCISAHAWSYAILLRRGSNTVVAMQLLKESITYHDFMAIANSMQKVNPPSKIFENDSVSSGWYQACFSLMISKGITKISSGTVTYKVTREACCTSTNL